MNLEYNLCSCQGVYKNVEFKATQVLGDMNHLEGNSILKSEGYVKSSWWCAAVCTTAYRKGVAACSCG